MKVHVVHSTSYDFKNELYSPLRGSELNVNHEVFLPHESEEFIKTKELIKDADVIVAEVSFSSTSIGIELGWADSYNKLIICMHKQDVIPSSSLKAVSHEFISYATTEELIIKLTEALDKIGN